MNAIINDIEIIKAKTTKINEVDFDNLTFEKVSNWSEHVF